MRGAFRAVAQVDGVAGFRHAVCSRSEHQEKRQESLSPAAGRVDGGGDPWAFRGPCRSPLASVRVGHTRARPCLLSRYRPHAQRTRNASAPTSPRSTCFCALWGCISSSSAGVGGPAETTSKEAQAAIARPGPLLSHASGAFLNRERSGRSAFTTTQTHSRRSFNIEHTLEVFREVFTKWRIFTL